MGNEQPSLPPITSSFLEVLQDALEVVKLDVHEQEDIGRMCGITQGLKQMVEGMRPQANDEVAFLRDVL